MINNSIKNRPHKLFQIASRAYSYFNIQELYFCQISKNIINLREKYNNNLL